MVDDIGGMLPRFPPGADEAILMDWFKHILKFRNWKKGYRLPPYKPHCVDDNTVGILLLFCSQSHIK